MGSQRHEIWWPVIRRWFHWVKSILYIKTNDIMALTSFRLCDFEILRLGQLMILALTLITVRLLLVGLAEWWIVSCPAESSDFSWNLRRDKNGKHQFWKSWLCGESRVCIQCMAVRLVRIYLWWGRRVAWRWHSSRYALVRRSWSLDLSGLLGSEIRFWNGGNLMQISVQVSDSLNFSLLVFRAM